MDIPKVIEDLFTAQNEHNSQTFASNFSEDAKVYDEGKTHQGIKAIRQWNEAANTAYKTKVKLVEIVDTGKKTVATVLVSGTFDGSPVTLNYNFGIENNTINSLKITG
ncbi:nuclear transport factor 2 family protein [Dyadobacter sp. NIV53]|uniref:nuclear transport factor 2 family protein n=1 Tax=Dyadobacter sp. NIV53 TaxID=2861765 RepID=UPI001C878F85|nr:nuclear transport factor 2 family protein [Dyadobacter sp. NIV53]